MDNALYGGLEMGGTKCIAVVGNDAGQLQQQLHIPTTDPEETLHQVLDFFKDYPDLKAIGIGSFGPINLDPASDSYGRLGKTPKHDWVDYDILSPLRSLPAELLLNTDVNCSAIGEQQYGSAKGLAHFVYYDSRYGNWWQLCLE